MQNEEKTWREKFGEWLLKIGQEIKQDDIPNIPGTIKVSTNIYLCKSIALKNALTCLQELGLIVWNIVVVDDKLDEVYIIVDPFHGK
ncbi:MAG: hypothetical protein AAB842_01670 [Patescibacteria group bacterium]